MDWLVSEGILRPHGETTLERLIYQARNQAEDGLCEQIAAQLTQEDRAQSAGEEGFWFLPGGRAEVGEPARVTLLRETQEELGEALQIGRLLYVVENFFTDASGTWHELGLYFLLSAPADSLLTRSLETFRRLDEVGNSLRFDWLPIAQLETFPLYPPLLPKSSQEHSCPSGAH